MITYIILFLVLLIILFTILYLYKKNNILKESYTERYTAIIIEPRKHKALSFVLENFLTNLPENWDFIIFHGNKNIEYINDILENDLFEYKDKIKLKNLNVNNLTLKDYNKLLVSKEFYDNVPTEIFLIFQTDSIICEDYKNLIIDYLKYDYIGAPWRDKNIGNGGLSLRRKSKMLEIIDKCPYKNEPEDIFFGTKCPEIYRNKPSFENSQNFSVETVYNDVSFGVHKPWRHMSKKKFENKNIFCKGLKELKELNDFY